MEGKDEAIKGLCELGERMRSGRHVEKVALHKAVLAACESMTTETSNARGEWAGLLERAVPFLHDEGAKYDDDGSNEPLELAREIETLLASLPSDESALSPASLAFDGGREAAPPPAAARGDVRGLVAKWREEATAYVVQANEKDKSGGFRWAGWMRDELRSKAGVCKRHADELESALAAEGVQAGEVE